MNKSEAIAIARKFYVAFHYPTGNDTPYEPPEWVLRAILEAAGSNVEPTPEMLTVQDGSALARSMFELAEEPEDVRTHVLNMRDFFLTMVTAYNTVGAYQAASNAQTMAVALHTFETNHSIADLAWPLEVIREDGDAVGLKTNDEDEPVRRAEHL